MSGYGQTPPGGGTLPWGQDQVAQPAVQPGPGNFRPPWYSAGPLQSWPAYTQALAGDPTYTTPNGATVWGGSGNAYAGPLTVVPTTVGDLLVATVANQGATSVASLSGGGVTTWTRVGTAWTDSEATPTILECWMGVVTTAGSTTLSITWNAAPGAHFCELNVQQFHTDQTGGTWVGELNTNRTNASASSVTWPLPTPPTQPPCIYVGYASTPSTISWSNPQPAAQGFATENGTPGNNSYVWATRYDASITPTLSVSISSTSYAIAALFYYSTATTAAPALADRAAAVESLAVSVAVPVADAAGAAEDIAGPAWTLVQQSAAPSTISAAGAVTPTLPGASTAGNLIIFKVLTGGSAAAPTAVTAGFTARANSQQASAPVSRCDVFDYIANPGGITTASATLANGGSGFLEEWTLGTGPPGAAVIPDATGSAKNVAPVSPFAIASAATAFPHELAVLTYTQRFSSATVATLAAGPGFTLAAAANNGSSAISHFGFDYDANTGPSGSTPSDATTTTSVAAGSQNGLAVTYAVPMPLAAVPVADRAGAVESLSVSVSVPVADAGGAADAVRQPMADLQDSFPGSAVDTTKWGSYGTATVASGTLTLTDTANSTASAGIQSNITYDLTGSYLLAHITNGGNQYASTQALIIVTLSAGNTAAIFVNNNNLVCQHAVASTYTQDGSITWVPSTMSWLRIRESGGTIFYDYSADGLSWTNLGSVANPWPVTALFATVQEGAYTTSDPAATSTWQSVNLPPTGASPALADAGAGVEALAVSATVPAADTAGAADQVTLAAAVPLAEVGAAAETVAVAATVPLAEAAGAAEYTPRELWEPAGAADQQAVQAAVPVAEVAAGTEALAVTVTLPVTDTAAGADALPQPPVSVSPADAAGASEALTAAATVPQSDAAAGVESLAASATLAATDVAAAADQLSVSATTSLADSGAGAEAPAATATVPLADVAGAFEASPRMLTELAAGADTLSTVAAVSYADAAGAAELLASPAAVPLPEVAGGYESLSVTAAVSLADAAGAADGVTPAAVVSLGDTGAAAEAQLIGVAPADAAAAAEALAVSAAVPAADAAGASEAISVASGSLASYAEAAGATDQPVITVASPAAEAAGAAETSVAAAALGIGDQAGAADAISAVVGAAPQLADAAGAADATGISASSPAADAAGAVESAAASATVPLPERAGAADAAAVSANLVPADAAAAADGLTTLQTAQPVLGDAGAGREAYSASVTTPSSDLAAVSDTLAVGAVQAVFFTDSAAAAESLIYVIPPTGPQPVWAVGPCAQRWLATATDPTWQVAATGPRWEAVASPPRWEVSAAPASWRVIMAVFDPVASISAENINATWTSDLGGAEVDPTTGPMPVKFAFPVSSGDELNPAQPATWFTGSWLADAGRYKGFIAQVIIGPTALGGLVQLARGGKFDVWSEVDTGSETVRKFVGVLAVY
jgi:trimeric autotransporter adhesin